MARRPPDREPDDPRVHTRAIDRLNETVDPVLLRRLARWDRFADRPPLSLPQAFREMEVHVDPRRFYAGYLGVRGEVEVPYELRRDLKEAVPQALLRDLHRVVRADIPVALEPLSEDPDPAGAAAYKAARAAQKREPLPIVTPMVEVVIEEQRRHHALRTEPWQPFRRDDEPRNT